MRACLIITEVCHNRDLLIEKYGLILNSYTALKKTLAADKYVLVCSTEMHRGKEQINP